MTQSEAPKVVKKKLFSPIWLLPIIALVLGAWLGVKSIKEAGVDVVIHFPNATGIEIGKTLVKYQGLTVGKVTDIGLDNDLRGVNVNVLMDYRSEPFLKEKTQFWLVKPKASITGVEGLDTLFSGNYIAIQPGDGASKKEFIAERETPAIQPGTDGLIISIMSPKLGSIDVGSPIFYRQVPVGNVISFKLDGNKQIIISAFIQEQYAHLVKADSRFWNVSGFQVDANLSGVSINTESIASILAGGIGFNSPESSEFAKNGANYLLHDNEETALGGIEFTLNIDSADNVSSGTKIQYRGISVGEVKRTELTDTGVMVHALVEEQYQALLTADSYLWLEGADIGFAGVKHLSRLVTGHVINILPGNDASPITQAFELHSQAPDLLSEKKLRLTLISTAHAGISENSEVRYKQLPIGQVTSVALSEDFNHVEYKVEINPEFTSLITQGSYFLSESAIDIQASLEAVSIKTRDLDTMVSGAISLVPGKSKSLVDPSQSLTLFESTDVANTQHQLASMIEIKLKGIDGADLSEGAPVYYKKLAIGHVNSIDWVAQRDEFVFTLKLHSQFKQLINNKTLYWRNSAVRVNASLAGVEIDVAPLAGAIKGSISLGHIDDEIITVSQAQDHLYASQSLALMQATVVDFSLPASAKVTDNAPIRYQGHQIGYLSQVKLAPELDELNAKAYLYGQYAEHFTKADAEFFVVDARISLAGIEAPETLITGPYIGATPGESDVISNVFNVKLESRFDANIPNNATRFTLVDEQLGSIKVGTPIFYRGINIGQIDGYQLNENGINVHIFGHIQQRYVHFVNQSSQFWDASGVKLEVGLFSGAQIETGSLETLLAGGISVMTEDVTTEQNALNNNSVFKLHNKMSKQWQNWKPLQSSPLQSIPQQ